VTTDCQHDPARRVFVSAHAIVRYLERCCGFEDEVAEATALYLASHPHATEAPEIFIITHVLSGTPLTTKDIISHILTPEVKAAVRAGASIFRTPELTFCIAQPSTICTILPAEMPLSHGQMVRHIATQKNWQNPNGTPISAVELKRQKNRSPISGRKTASKRRPPPD